MAETWPKDPPSASSSEEDGVESSSDEVNKVEDKPHTKQQENDESSDDGESEEDSDEGEEESSEEEEAQPTPKNSSQKKPPTRKALEPPPSEMAETDGSSEPNDDNEEASVKPNASKKASSGKPAVVSKRASKRVMEVPNKKQKTVMVAEGYESNKAIYSSEKKRPAFTRVWSEGDEITLLKGMIEFESDKGTDPMSDMNKFYQVIRKSKLIQFDFSEKQLIDKIKKLKKKYRGNVVKFAGSDENPIFSKTHDADIYLLSKQIWGNLGANLGAGSTRSVSVSKKSKAIVIADSGKRNTNTVGEDNNGAPAKPEEEDVNTEEEEHKVNHSGKKVAKMYPFIYETIRSMDGMNFLKGLDLSVIDRSKMEDLEQKIKQRKLAEVALNCEKMKHVKDVFELMGASGY